jgi:benzoyl-CoA-dihydrodiol lyase
VETDGPVARIVLATDEGAGVRPGYELKLNSYDLGVDIELHDAVQRLRFEHPEVRAVVITSGLDKVFCAGANIRMLAQADHAWKVNFCKFTNETRGAIEDAGAESGQGLVDEIAPPSKFADTVQRRAQAAAQRSHRSPGGPGITLDRLDRSFKENEIAYPHVTADLDRAAGLVTITVRGPRRDARADMAAARAQGAGFWPLAVTRELDDLILWLRTNETELGTWLIKTSGDAGAVLGYERLLAGALGTDWLADEIRSFTKRTLKRLDVTSRSLFALIEPGSCFAGPLLELALACDRQFMLNGQWDADMAPDAGVDPGGPAAIVLSAANFGAFPMASGLTRLASRFTGDPGRVAKLEQHTGRPIEAGEALDLGLVTFAPDDLDWDDEIRIACEERASLSPDALTGMEANLRFAGPETCETNIFGRLTAWQNWVFTRPNASGPEGALRRYGTGQAGAFDRNRA